METPLFNFIIRKKVLGSHVGTYYKTKYEYSGGLLIYAGIAPKGSATSDSVWVIIKRTWTDNALTAEDTSADNVKWDDRASLSYS